MSTMSTPPPPPLKNSAKGYNLDPTGMFRNRGRHIVVASGTALSPRLVRDSDRDRRGDSSITHIVSFYGPTTPTVSQDNSQLPGVGILSHPRGRDKNHNYKSDRSFMSDSVSVSQTRKQLHATAIISEASSSSVEREKSNTFLADMNSNNNNVAVTADNDIEHDDSHKICTKSTALICKNACTQIDKQVQNCIKKQSNHNCERIYNDCEDSTMSIMETEADDEEENMNMRGSFLKTDITRISMMQNFHEERQEEEECPCYDDNDTNSSSCSNREEECSCERENQYLTADFDDNNGYKYAPLQDNKVSLDLQCLLDEKSVSRSCPIDKTMDDNSNDYTSSNPLNDSLECQVNSCDSQLIEYSTIFLRDKIDGDRDRGGFLTERQRFDCEKNFESSSSAAASRAACMNEEFELLSNVYQSNVINEVDFSTLANGRTHSNGFDLTDSTDDVEIGHTMTTFTSHSNKSAFEEKVHSNIKETIYNRYNNNYILNDNIHKNLVATEKSRERESSIRTSLRRKTIERMPSIESWTPNVTRLPRTKSCIIPTNDSATEALMLPTIAVTNPSKSSVFTEDRVLEKPISVSRLLPLPFQLARKCFSFDDTTLDDDVLSEMYLPKLDIEGKSRQLRPCNRYRHRQQFYSLSAVASFPSDFNEDSSILSKSLKSTIPLNRSARNLNSNFCNENCSKVSSGSMSPTTHDLIASPFRSTILFQHNHQQNSLSHCERLSKTEHVKPFGIIRRCRTWDPDESCLGYNYSTKGYHSNNVNFPESTSFKPRLQTSMHNYRIDPLRKELGPTEIFPAAVNNVEINKTEQKTSKNLQSERDDAIDLLAGIVMQCPKFDDLFGGFLCEKCSTQKLDHMSHLNDNCAFCIDRMKQLANSIKQLNALHGNQLSSSPKLFSDEELSNAIDLLVKCYEFSLSMKAATVSARKWLEFIRMEKSNPCISSEGDINQALVMKMIHQSQNVDLSNKQREIDRLNSELSLCHDEIETIKKCSRSQHTQYSTSVDRSILSDTSSDDSIDAIIKKDNVLVLSFPRTEVALSESRDESFAKFEKKLEADLKLECRKEILLLKATLAKSKREISFLKRNLEIRKRKDPFHSEIDPILTNDDGQSERIFMKIAEDIENGSIEESLFDNSYDLTMTDDMDESPKITIYDSCFEKDLEEYRTALIETMNVQGCSTSSEAIDYRQDVSQSHSSELSVDQKLVNVHMIDGENFMTEWDIVAPLPPPPDHGLHSPIVDTILSRWTNDVNTQSALINWVEKVLNGSCPESIPSLKISGLDHQLKDGFIMHLFPLLLSRKDIRVDVASRAKRTTSYDIAVSVSQAVSETQSQTSFVDINSIHRENSVRLVHPMRSYQYSGESKHNLMAFRATCSGVSVRSNHTAQASVQERKIEKDVSSLMLKQKQSKVPILETNGSTAGSISTAITSPISNRTPTKSTPRSQTNPYEAENDMFYNPISESSRVKIPFCQSNKKSPLNPGESPSLIDELSVGSSTDESESKHSYQSFRQSGIINSLGGALGLLSKRKSPVSSPALRSAHLSSVSNASKDYSASTVTAPPCKLIPLHEESFPHHRLVSAPPGKIGLTFVEHCGHCMVSNVADVSPLAGWVYPCDILIAVDNTPVSGLRTKDIVKLLTAKNDERRVLRLIAYHFMEKMVQ